MINPDIKISEEIIIQENIPYAPDELDVLHCPCHKPGKISSYIKKDFTCSDCGYELTKEEIFIIKMLGFNYKVVLWDNGVGANIIVS
jgi:hypothetical protein